MSTEHLATYLNDHLAGSKVALELLDHLLTEASERDHSLNALRTEIEYDRHQLLGLMQRLHIPESRIRQVGAWIAERFTAAKLGIDDDPRGDLRRLERLEALALGIHGKVALWDALDNAVRTNPQLAGLNYRLLAQRGREQRARIEAMRVEAAIGALAP